MLIFRDNATSQTYTVPPGGAVVGREGGDANILVQDPRVSKRHARLFAAEGRWWLEDLRSANGSYIEMQRIESPVELNAGTAFVLGDHPFEVIDIVQEEPRLGQSTAATVNEMASFQELETDGPHPVGPVIPMPVSARPIPMIPGGPQEFEGSGMQEEPTSAEISPAGGAVEPARFSLAEVPELAFSPNASILDAIANPRFPALEGMPLFRFALPALVATAVLQVAGGLVTAVLGIVAGVSVMAALRAALTLSVSVAIGAVLAGLIAAFIFHPVTVFIVERVFGGRTTTGSRTNFFANVLSAGVVASAVGALAQICMAAAVIVHAHVPKVSALFPIVSGLLGLACLGLFVLLEYRWLTSFRVKPLGLIIVLVLGGLAAAGSVYSTVTTVVAFGQETAAPQGAPAEVARPNSPAPGAQVAKPEAPAPGEKSAASPKSEEAKGSPSAKPSAKPEAKGEPKSESKAEAKAESKPQPKTGPAGAEATASPAPAVIPPPVQPMAAAPAPAVKLTAYQRFAQRKDAVERAITDDPLLLKKDSAIAKSYKAFRSAVQKARKAEASKAGGDEVLLKHLVDADVFSTQAKVIEELYSRLHLSNRPPAPAEPAAQ